MTALTKLIPSFLVVRVSVYHDSTSRPFVLSLARVISAHRLFFIPRGIFIIISGLDKISICSNMRLLEPSVGFIGSANPPNDRCNGEEVLEKQAKR